MFKNFFIVLMVIVSLSFGQENKSQSSIGIGYMFNGCSKGISVDVIESGTMGFYCDIVNTTFGDLENEIENTYDEMFGNDTSFSNIIDSVTKDILTEQTLTTIGTIFSLNNNFSLYLGFTLDLEQLFGDKAGSTYGIDIGGMLSTDVTKSLWIGAYGGYNSALLSNLKFGVKAGFSLK
jgi:hypothetical protein